MPLSRRVVLAARPDGIPQAQHFRVEAHEPPAPKPGEIVVRNQFLSVEPAMRGWVSAVANYAEPVGIGEVMRSFASGEVIASEHPGYRPGDKVTGMFGWQEVAVVPASASAARSPRPTCRSPPRSACSASTASPPISASSMSGSRSPATRWWSRPPRARSARRSGRSPGSWAVARSGLPAARRRCGSAWTISAMTPPSTTRRRTTSRRRWPRPAPAASTSISTTPPAPSPMRCSGTSPWARGW